MNNSPRISVCMATYNGSRFIEQQISSILAQLALDDEIVVSDDGSTDQTLSVLNSISDDRIRVLPAHEKLGVVGNFENALMHARGKLIFLSDQDDVWIEGKVDACVNALRFHDLVVTDCSVVNENLKLIAPSFFAIRSGSRGIIGTLIRNRFMGCCMAFRREVIEGALPFPKSIPMHDSWIGLVALSMGEVSFLHAPYLLYRRHEHAVTEHGSSRRSKSSQIRDRWRLLRALLLRCGRLIKLRQRKNLSAAAQSQKSDVS